MAIKVKAVERNVSFDKKSEKWAYVMQPELYSKLSQNKVISEASKRSGIAEGAISVAWNALSDVIKTWATEGHAVSVPGLGTMRFGLRATSVENVADVMSKLITSRRVIFTPNSEIKEELAHTSVSITCYDRTGKIVKRVTSDDEADVEGPDDNPDDDNPGGGTPDNNPSGGGSSSGNPSGGGSSTGGNDEGVDEEG